MSASENKRRSGLSDKGAVSRLVSQAREAQAAEEAGPGYGKGQPGHAGELGQDKRGQDKATYYLPRRRQDLVRQMADTEEVSQTDIVEAAVLAFYNAWKTGKLRLDDYKTAARSLRALWKLDLPDEFSFFSEDAQR